MKNLGILKEVCDAIIADPSLRPIKNAQGQIIETHCNFGAIRVANSLGCHELDGKMADDQYGVMSSNSSGLWVRVDGAAATAFALTGGLAFAAMSSKQLGEIHGHITAIYPAPMQWSGSLNKNVPVVANVGVVDAEEKESMAFPVARGEPDYFVYHG